MQTTATRVDPAGTTAGVDMEGALNSAVGGACAVSKVKKAEGVMTSLEVWIDTDVPTSLLGQLKASIIDTSHQKDSKCSKL